MDEQELIKYRIPDDEYRNHNIITDPPNEAGLDLDDVNGIANEILEYAIPLISAKGDYEGYLRGHKDASDGCEVRLAEARKQERERIIKWLEKNGNVTKVFEEGSMSAWYTGNPEIFVLKGELWQALKEGGKEAE